MLCIDIVPLSGDQPATPLRRVPRLINAPHHEARKLSPCVGILDDLRYHMRHTVFKLTFNILSLFINIHHAHAICDHVSSMMWSRLFCRPRQDLHSVRDLKNLYSRFFKTWLPSVSKANYRDRDTLISIPSRDFLLK
jgi:hypothetical protein